MQFPAAVALVLVPLNFFPSLVFPPHKLLSEKTVSIFSQTGAETVSSNLLVMAVAATVGSIVLATLASTQTETLVPLVVALQHLVVKSLVQSVSAAGTLVLSTPHSLAVGTTGSAPQSIVPASP